MDEKTRAFLENEPEKLDVLYRWKPTAAELANRMRDDLADEYLVTRTIGSESCCGLVLWGRWGRKWQCNPWSSRPMIRHLLGRVAALERALGPLVFHARLRPPAKLGEADWHWMAAEGAKAMSGPVPEAMKKEPAEAGTTNDEPAEAGTTNGGDE